MANKTNYWYILVLTESGAKFVTNILPHRTAEWDELGKPMEFTQNMAKEIAKGLMLNFNTAFPVCSPIELDKQPYNYQDWKIEWVKKDKSKETVDKAE